MKATHPAYLAMLAVRFREASHTPRKRDSHTLNRCGIFDGNRRGEKIQPKWRDRRHKASSSTLRCTRRAMTVM